MRKKHLSGSDYVTFFWGRTVKQLNGCIEWQGSKRRGYGTCTFDGKQVGTHRISYELSFGKIPEGQFVLHKCDNPACCNPEHLFLGTQQDNVQDMIDKGRHWKKGVTHCKSGHEYTPENTILKSNNARFCRICCTGGNGDLLSSPKRLGFYPSGVLAHAFNKFAEAEGFTSEAKAFEFIICEGLRERGLLPLTVEK